METDYQPGDDPVAVGELVQYFGSQQNGLYEIADHRDPLDHPYINTRSHPHAYPDGVAYSLWPHGVPKKLHNADRAVGFVRRTSFRLTGRQVLTEEARTA